MSFENYKQNDFIKNLTPTLNLLNEFKNTPTENQKSLVLKESCEERKKSLEYELIKGINISNEKEFDALIGLLTKNGIIKEPLKLEDLKDNNGKSLLKSRTYKNIMLSLRKIPQTSNKISVYITNSNRFFETDIFPRSGYINNDGKFEYNPDTNFKSYDDKTNPNKNIGKIPEDTGECRVEDKILKPEIKKETTPEKTHIDYKINKGENLWDIVKNHYDLTQSDNPDRDIANIIIKLSKLKENKGVIHKKNGNDITGFTLLNGKNLYLPKDISTTRLPNRDTKNFSFKKQET